MEKIDPGTAVRILDALHLFKAFHETLSAEERRLVELSRLAEFTRSERWFELVSGDAQAHDAFLAGRRVLEGCDFLERLAKVLELKEHANFDGTTKLGGGEYGHFHLIVRDTANDPISVLVLSRVLVSIQDVYDGFCRLDGAAGQDLTVLATDSGSNKLFDLGGLSGPIEKMKEFLVELWDRILLKPSPVSPTNLRAIDDSLTVIARLDSLVRDGSLNEAEGEKLRKSILRGAHDLLRSDAMPLDVLTTPPRTVQQIQIERRAQIPHQPSGERTEPAAPSPKRSSKTRRAAKQDGRP